jgi:hypothetical protein
MILALDALRGVVDADALGGVVRLEGHRRTVEVTGVGQRRRTIGERLQHEEHCRADARPRARGPHPRPQVHHCSGTIGDREPRA